MTIVKNKLRTTMSQQILDSLMLLFIEQSKTNNIDTDEVIEEFKTLNDTTRRMVLELIIVTIYLINCL